jgi:hypothetical protein
VLAVQIEGQCRFNPLAQPGVAGQGGEVEPHESDEVSQGWGERGQALHSRISASPEVIQVYPSIVHDHDGGVDDHDGAVDDHDGAIDDGGDNDGGDNSVARYQDRHSEDSHSNLMVAQ